MENPSFSRASMEEDTAVVKKDCGKSFQRDLGFSKASRLILSCSHWVSHEPHTSLFALAKSRLRPDFFCSPISAYVFKHSFIHFINSY